MDYDAWHKEVERLLAMSHTLRDQSATLHTRSQTTTKRLIAALNASESIAADAQQSPRQPPPATQL
jgi:hypothetical protein